MALNKRGIIFSFMALLAVGLLLILLRPDQTELTKDRQEVIKTRVSIANEYVRTLRENYLPSIVYVTSYKALGALTIYVGNTDFFTDKAAFDAAFREVLMNGTIGGVDINALTAPGTFDKNLTFRMRELANASHEFLSVDTNFTYDYDTMKVDIFQDNTTQGRTVGPWNVVVNVSFNYTVRTAQAYWNRTDDIIVVFSIDGLQDPLYVASTDGVATNYIRRTNFSAWDIITFQTHVNNSWYDFEGTAPGYLQRFYNDTTPSTTGCCGIESFVRADVDELLTPFPGDGEPRRSYVDCAYFGGQCSALLGSPLSNLWNITRMTNATYKFGLDQYRTFARYNLSDYAYH